MYRTKKQKSQENSRIGLDIRIDKNRVEYISTLSTMYIYIFLSSLVYKQLFSGFNVFEIFAWWMTGKKTYVGCPSLVPCYDILSISVLRVMFSLFL